MTSLKIFLKALEELYPNVYFIDKLVIKPHNVFKAYKEFTLEIWKLENNKKELLCGIIQQGKSTTGAQEEHMKESITKEAIKQLWNLMNTKQV